MTFQFQVIKRPFKRLYLDNVAADCSHAVLEFKRILLNAQLTFNSARGYTRLHC